MSDLSTKLQSIIRDITIEEVYDFNKTPKEFFQHKLALFSLRCLKILYIYEQNKTESQQFAFLYRDDLEKTKDDFNWCADYYEMDGNQSDDCITVLEIVCNIPYQAVKKLSCCKIRKIGKHHISRNLHILLIDMIQYDYNYEYKSEAESIMYRILGFSSKNYSMEQHGQIVFALLERMCDSLPQLADLICCLEESYFEQMDDFYYSNFLWFYGSVQERLAERERASQLFYQSYQLRRQLYGENEWCTAVTWREYMSLSWYDNRNRDAFRCLQKFIDNIEHHNYTNMDVYDAEIVQGKTLVGILMEQSAWDDLDVYDHYLSIYERICEKYAYLNEPAISQRLSQNLRGIYYLNKGDYIQAEMMFLLALNAETAEITKSILSDIQIKGNLCMIYYIQNDLDKVLPLIDELLEILSRDEEYTIISMEDEYRLYYIMVDLTKQFILELDHEYIYYFKELLSETCMNIMKDVSLVAGNKKAILAYVCSMVDWILQNENASKSELILYFNTLIKIDENQDSLNLNTVQSVLIQYTLAILAWTLKEKKTEMYIQNSIKALKQTNLFAIENIPIYRTAAMYYGKNGNHEIGVQYLKKMTGSMEEGWHSYVRYLNDTRLIQILFPLQIQFASCYAMARKELPIDEAYELLLRFKSIASLAGRERNRIIHSGKIDGNLLQTIQSLQNRMANMEAQSLFRNISDEYKEDEQELRKLERDFAVQFPQNNQFMEITWDRVKNAIPEHSAVVEYFFTVNDYGRNPFEKKLTEEDFTVIDIYVARKQNGRCTLNQCSIKNGTYILEKTHDFVSILQNISDDSVSLKQLNRLDSLREELYQSLIIPILTWIEKQDTLYFAPDWDLLNLPFEILYDKEHRRLLEDYHIVRIECARDFLFESEEQQSEKGSLVIGNPSYEVKGKEIEKGETDDSDFKRNYNINLNEIDPLPCAETEAERIGKRLGARCVTGPKATKQLFLSAEGYENIHIATHGFFEESEQTNALYSSSLFFSGAKDWLRTGREDALFGNGIVTADEVSRMNLCSTNLVVLSSCMGGMNEISYNKGFYGMVGAVSAAGARYVVAHLWKAEDFSTAVFMDMFYYYYAQEKLAPPDALTQAQKYLRTVTVGTLREHGWFDDIRRKMQGQNSKNMAMVLEQCDDRLKPFKNEAYWGGFACYRCN